MDPAAAQHYCRDKAAAEGSSVHYASLFQPEAERRGLAALFALYYELLESVTAASDPGVIRIKLQWWCEELARLQQGQPRHPVAQELQRLQEQDRIEIAPLLDLPAAMETLFALAPGAAAEDWPEAAGLGEFWIGAAAGNSRPAPEEARALAGTGIAIARLETLQNLPHLVRLGFNPLPLGPLKTHDVHDADLRSQVEADKVRDLAAELIRELETDLEQHYAVFSRHTLRQRAFAPIMNRIARATCREIRRDGHLLLSRKVALTPIRKFRIAVGTRYFGRLF